MNESDLDLIEVDIKETKETIERADNILKLIENPIFKEVIERGYFEDEAIRLVSAKSNPAMQTEECQRSLDGYILGIGALQQYLGAQIRLGNTARNVLDSHYETRDELLKTDIEED